MLCASSAPVGGGLGPRSWALNAEVADDYERLDVDEHVGEIAAALHLQGEGVGMLTAARVARHRSALEEGVDVDATVGLSHPTWAASEDDATARWQPGTINVVVSVPVRLSDAAMLNVVMTATEAKTQALWHAGIDATGTASDALTVLCPLTGDPERFGGPRSTWGARVARAVHRAVLAGARDYPS
jgi:adenosylcobinamide amidohydrolase